MADDPGHPRPDLGLGSPAPDRIGFFELLRRIEGDGRRFARAGGDPARLGQRARLGFATGDIAGLHPAPDAAPRIDVDALGLFGPEGALPLHLTRRILTRQAERWFGAEGGGAAADTAFLDFCNLLQHRHLAFYWRAWADNRPEVEVEQGGGRSGALIDMLACIGLPGLREENDATADPDLARRMGTTLARPIPTPDSLQAFVADLLGVPAAVIEFRGHWRDIPAALQTRPGRAHARLGAGALVGARIFQRQHRAELRLGPMTLPGFLALIDDPRALAALRRAILFVAGQDVTFDLRLVVRRDQIPAPRLGSCRLNRTAWLGTPPSRDAGDCHLPGFSAARAA